MFKAARTASCWLRESQLCRRGNRPWRLFWTAEWESSNKSVCRKRWVTLTWLLKQMWRSTQMLHEVQFKFIIYCIMIIIIIGYIQMSVVWNSQILVATGTFSRISFLLRWNELYIHIYLSENWLMKPQLPPQLFLFSAGCSIVSHFQDVQPKLLCFCLRYNLWQ